jgi:hypothetical protein
MDPTRDSKPGREEYRRQQSRDCESGPVVHLVVPKNISRRRTRTLRFFSCPTKRVMF